MSNETYAILDLDDRAVNFILWDGVTSFGLPPGQRAVLIPKGASYGYGWAWDGTGFVNPNPPPPDLTPEGGT